MAEVPQAIIDAAAEAAYLEYLEHYGMKRHAMVWDALSDRYRDVWRKVATASLTAAAPHVYGQGRDDEAGALPIPDWEEITPEATGANWRTDRAKLTAIRTLAESLGDRSAEPRETTRPSDRRLMEPLRRMLLRILDGDGDG